MTALRCVTDQVRSHRGQTGPPDASLLFDYLEKVRETLRETERARPPTGRPRSNEEAARMICRSGIRSPSKGESIMKKRTARVLTALAAIIVVLGVTYAVAVAVSAAKLRRAYAATREGWPPHAGGGRDPAEVRRYGKRRLALPGRRLAAQGPARSLERTRPERKRLLSYIGKLGTCWSGGAIEPNGLGRTCRMYSNRMWFPRLWPSSGQAKQRPAVPVRTGLHERDADQPLVLISRGGPDARRKGPLGSPSRAVPSPGILHKPS